PGWRLLAGRGCLRHSCRARYGPRGLARAWPRLCLLLGRHPEVRAVREHHRSGSPRRRPDAGLALGRHALGQGAGGGRPAAGLRRGLRAGRVRRLHGGVAAGADVVRRSRQVVGGDPGCGRVHGRRVAGVDEMAEDPAAGRRPRRSPGIGADAMDIIAGLGQGFAVALQPINLLYCFIGVFIGTLVGVLPGIGPVSAMSLLLPVTLSGTPEAGIIMMAGIYYGSMYGGSTTSILV